MKFASKQLTPYERRSQISRLSFNQTQPPAPHPTGNWSRQFGASLLAHLNARIWLLAFDRSKQLQGRKPFQLSQEWLNEVNFSLVTSVRFTQAHQIIQEKNKFSKILDARRRQTKAHLCCRGQSKGRTFWFFHQPRRLAFPKKLKRRRKKFKKHLFMHFYSTTSRLFILYFLTLLLYIGLCYISPLANILRFPKVFRRY